MACLSFTGEIEEILLFSMFEVEHLPYSELLGQFHESDLGFHDYITWRNLVVLKTLYHLETAEIFHDMLNYVEIEDITAICYEL